MKPFEVRYSRNAEADLDSIREHLAKARSEAFARTFVERIITYCDGFAQTPHRGTMCDDICEGLRTVGWRKVVTIAFRVREDRRQVQIAGVFYRGRDVASAMRRRGG